MRDNESFPKVNKLEAGLLNLSKHKRILHSTVPFQLYIKFPPWRRRSLYNNRHLLYIAHSSSGKTRDFDSRMVGSTPAWAASKRFAC